MNLTSASKKCFNLPVCICMCIYMNIKYMTQHFNKRVCVGEGKKLNHVSCSTISISYITIKHALNKMLYPLLGCLLLQKSIALGMPWFGIKNSLYLKDSLKIHQYMQKSARNRQIYSYVITELIKFFINCSEVKKI